MLKVAGTSILGVAESAESAKSGASASQINFACSLVCTSMVASLVTRPVAAVRMGCVIMRDPTAAVGDAEEAAT